MKLRKIIFGVLSTIIVFTLLMQQKTTAETSYDKKAIIIRDSLLNQSEPIFEKIVLKAAKMKWDTLAIGDLIVKIGKEFLGTPYVGFTLEHRAEEICTVNLFGLDCVTFFESSLDIARVIKKQEYNIHDLLNELTFTRYRNGMLTDYTSRLHYTSDWIYDNINKAVVKDVSKELGGIKKKFDLFFMSKNSKYYDALKRDPSLIPVMRGIEAAINKRTYYYIPKEKIRKAEEFIQNGDIICIVTNQDGLDYSHTGLAVKDGKRTRLMHASSAKKKVILDTFISDYMNGIESNIGISVLRPNPVSESND